MVNFNNFRSKQKYFAAFSFAFFLFLGFQITAAAQVKQDSMMTISVIITQYLRSTEDNIIITKADETQEIIPIKRSKSWTQAENTAKIDLAIAKKLNEYLRQGWQLFNESHEMHIGADTGSVVFYRYILIK
jgi:hypothetical protein